MIFLFNKGMTLVVEKGELLVARIIHGGMIDRQGNCTHKGITVKPVLNGHPWGMAN